MAIKRAAGEQKKVKKCVYINRPCCTNLKTISFTHKKLGRPAMASKIEVEVGLKSDAEKIWKSVRESTTVFPKALPHLYQSIQVVEGDGNSVASVRLVNYPPGLSAISSIKEKIELVDEEKKTLSYCVVEGDVLKYYTNFKASLSVGTKGDINGSWVKWWCEFDKASEEFPNPDLIRDFAIKTFQDLDVFLLANP